MTQMDDVAAGLAREFPRCRVDFRLLEKENVLQVTISDDFERTSRVAEWPREDVPAEDAVKAITAKIRGEA